MAIGRRSEENESVACPGGRDVGDSIFVLAAVRVSKFTVGRARHVRADDYGIGLAALRPVLGRDGKTRLLLQGVLGGLRIPGPDGLEILTILLVQLYARIDGVAQSIDPVEPRSGIKFRANPGARDKSFVRLGLLLL